MIQGAILVDITPKSADKERGRRELSAREGRKSEKGANYPLEETKWPGEKPGSQEARKPRSQEGRKTQKAEKKSGRAQPFLQSNHIIPLKLNGDPRSARSCNPPRQGRKSRPHRSDS